MNQETGFFFLSNMSKWGISTISNLFFQNCFDLRNSSKSHPFSQTLLVSTNCPFSVEKRFHRTIPNQFYCCLALPWGTQRSTKELQTILAVSKGKGTISSPSLAVLGHYRIVSQWIHLLVPCPIQFVKDPNKGAPTATPGTWFHRIRDLNVRLHISSSC